jgi:hypothetical protein
MHISRFCVLILLPEVGHRLVWHEDSSRRVTVYGVLLSGHAYRPALGDRGDHVAVPSHRDPAGRVMLGERLTSLRLTGLCLAAASLTLIAAAEADRGDRRPLSEITAQRVH